jgi:O-antigen/teichoic acid export membrane protein
MGLLNQIAVNSLYRFVYLILQFLITIFISRLIGPGGLGTYSLILANASVLLVFSSLGIPAGITFHSAKKDISPGLLIRIAFISAVFQMLLILIIETVHWLITKKFLIWPVTNPVAGILGIIFFLSLLITERYAALYSGNKQLQYFNFQLVIFSLMTLFPLIYWNINQQGTSEFKVIAMIIILSLLQVILLGFIFQRLRRKHPINETTGGNANSRFFSYSMLAWLANSIQFLVYRIDFWILHYFHGETELGLYALAVRIGQTFWILPGLLATVILPYLTSIHFDRNILERIIRITNTANLLLALLLAVCARWFIPWIFGEAFSAAVLPLLILLPGVLFMSMHTFLSAYFAGKNKVSFNLQASIFSLVLITFLDFLLIPPLGKTGAALASTIAYTAGCGYAMVVYYKMEHYPMYRLLIQKQDLQWLGNNFSRMLSIYTFK